MSKLLLSEINRMRKSKIFWLCVIAVLGVTVWIMMMGNRAAQKINVTLEYYYFQLGPFIPFFYSVFISMLMGTEYSNNTIRNKLIIGHTRGQIYLAYYLTCLIGAEFLVAVWLVGGLIGIPMLGVWTVGVETVIGFIIITLLYCAALTAIFTFFGMMISSKSVSVVTQFIFALLIILAASMLYNGLCEPEMSAGMVLVDGKIVMSEPEPNPMYIGGFLRKICVLIVNILPTGQGILMLHQETSGDIPIMIPLQIISSVVISVGLTAVGILAFRRKNLR